MKSASDRGPIGAVDRARHAAWIADRDDVRGNVMRDDRTCANHRAVADRDLDVRDAGICAECYTCMPVGRTLLAFAEVSGLSLQG